MGMLLAFFGVIVTLFFLGGAVGIWHSDHHCTPVAHECTVRRWWHDALLSALAILLKVMVSRELWGFFLMGLCSCNRIYQHS